MDWGVFGLKESPFSVTPDPSYLFLTLAHEGALSTILYGVGERKGFILVTGEVGTGKTTLCRALMGQLDQSVHKALVLSSNLERDELIRIVAADFGLRDGEAAEVVGLEALNRFLVERLDRGENAVLVIDEAQNLPESTLEELRLLSNLETDRQKLVQIVLVGQPELREKLKKPALRSLDQRIAVRYRLRALSRDETEAYVRHRVKVASTAAAPLPFTPRALGAVHSSSRGLPRLINSLSDRALVEAAAEGAAAADVRHVRAAAKAVDAFPPRWLPPGGWRSTLAVAAGVLALGLFALSAFRGGGPPEPPPAPPPGPAPLSFVEQEEAGTLNTSLAALFRLWKMDYLAEESRRWKISNVSSTLLQFYFDDSGIADQYGVEFHGVEPEMSALRHLGIPCLFGFREEGSDVLRYGLLTGLGGGEALVVDSAEGGSWRDAEALFGDVEGPLLCLLRGRGASKALKRGMRGSEVMSLQERLKEAGHFAGVPDGAYGPATVRAVQAFQRETGLESDGVAGVATRLAVDRASGLFVPSLEKPQEE